MVHVVTRPASGECLDHIYAPWDAAFVFEETDDIIDTWYDIFNGILDKHAPAKTKRIKRISQPKWFTGDLNDEIKKRDCLLRKARNSRNPGDWMLFREAKNRVTKFIRNTKKAFFKSQVEENRNCPKKLWSLIRDLTRDSQGKDCHVRELDEDGEIVTEDIHIAELFNSTSQKSVVRIPYRPDFFSEVSINDETKFVHICLERPNTRGRPPKHYHPLLKKEKELASIVKRILPKSIADLLVQRGSRLAHLYCLPKTHKETLAMRPILSSTGSYNYKLAKWLDEKLKPLSTNDHSIGDTFSFADNLQEIEISDDDTLVSYDVSALFTNVPVDETIGVLARKAFKDDWFNKEYNLNITEADLKELLEVSTKNQLFHFQGVLYEQVHGVTMGSPLGPLMANVFMCNIEERLIHQNEMPTF
ncbi:hypothetical protein AWC38_SpisGene6667 [Stylophora pistillata]|uniref:Reverse transcriptase domain-containing protein n=1 Tax=Stylophora pistillata TaxID=50429 RepID=A0A2B4SIC3_STYPI|nr:hypothetical protein AWC38_SpisGene6667 [Stylophora pistillata]